jgi:DNA polymerase-3 subunit gamma/tau
MSYQVIARKYRPQRFSDVVGQEHVTQTLRNAIEQSRIAHAYLFVGPRGTGKTTIARIFAKALNCTGGPKADFLEDDERCIEITEGRSLDVLEIDGASNRGIEEIRALRDTGRYAPASGKYNIYIIDEVHMLTKEAFNALLNTLEEPPEHVKFMFATTEPEKVLATFLSRCQRFDLRRSPGRLIMNHLAGIAQNEGGRGRRRWAKAPFKGGEPDDARRACAGVHTAAGVRARGHVSPDSPSPRRPPSLQRPTSLPAASTPRGAHTLPNRLLTCRASGRGIDPHARVSSAPRGGSVQRCQTNS